MPEESTTYHVDLTPEAARDLLLSSAEEYFSFWRWTGEKAYHKKFWVKFEDGRPYLQLKPYFQSEYPSKYSQYTTWMGLEINQTAFGSSVEIVWKKAPGMSCTEIGFPVFLGPFLLLGLTTLVNVIRSWNMTVDQFFIIAYSAIFPMYWYYLRRYILKIARANRAQMLQMVDAALKPHLHPYAMFERKVEPSVESE